MSKDNIVGSMYLTEPEYDWYGQDVGWKTNTIYRDEFGSMPFSYFYSPDGVGRVWHNTLEEIYEYVFLPNTPIVIVRKARKADYE